ncbi:peptidase [Cellulomonas sp.]|uniref:peptidase n=1 Tax=Cellulomonas sp. TaxID=40001 RepID=UPI003BAB44C5
MKIRRTALVAVAAVALALVPSAAFSYGASDYTNKGTVSDTTPAAGESFTVTVAGPAGASVTLTITSNPASIPDSAITIAGTKSLAKVTNASGVAVFTVTLSQAGTFTLVATDTASGAVLSTQTVSVAAAAGAAGSLSSTGSNALPIALGAGALVLVGAGGVVVARRRQVGAAA